MNARQKCKQMKKQLAALYEDYITSAMATQELMNVVAGNIQKVRDQQVSCVVREQFDQFTYPDEYLAIKMWEQLTYDQKFRQAVVFEGHTDPDTGKYIVEAKLTVVMPEFDEEEEC